MAGGDSGASDDWGRLVRALQTEADALGGYGELTVTITLHDGRPRNLEVTHVRKRYRLAAPRGNSAADGT